MFTKQLTAHNCNYLSLSSSTEIENGFNNIRIGYNEEMNSWLLAVKVFENYAHERYYVISHEDYLLYKENIKAFSAKFKPEIEKKIEKGSNRNLIGSSCLFDYDAIDGIQYLLSQKTTITEYVCVFELTPNPIIFARVSLENAVLPDGKTGTESILIPPLQIIPVNKKIYFGENCIRYPLRESISLLRKYKAIVNGEKETVLYGIKTEKKEQ